MVLKERKLDNGYLLEQQNPTVSIIILLIDSILLWKNEMVYRSWFKGMITG